jgi:hypothetical protein
MAFGEGVAQSFQVPFYQEPAPRAARPVAAPKEEQFDLASVGLDKPVFDLQSTANVGERMAQYYKDFNDAQQFAKSMWKNYKIDVTAPDPSNPVSVRASEAFGKMLANLQFTQNMAKRAEVQLQNAQQAYLSGNADLNPNAFSQGRFFSEFTPQEQSISNLVPEYLQDAGKATSRTTDNRENYNQLTKDYALLMANAEKTGDPKLIAWAKSQRPLFNVEASKAGSGSGRTFIDTALEEIALMAEGSSKYYTATNKYDSGGGKILRSDKFKGKTIGRRDASGKQISFIVDHVEYRPGEGGMFFVDAGNNIIPVTSTDVVETYSNLSDVPKTQLYKHIGERFGTDALTAKDFISTENLPTLANRDELMQEAPQVGQKRTVAATQIAEGTPSTFGLGPFFGNRQVRLPWNKNTVVKNPISNQEVEVRPEGDDLVSVSAADWKKITGSSQGTITVGNQVIDKTTATNGIPKELMLRVLETADFEIPGMETSGSVGTSTSQADFNAKWATLSPGQKLKAPNGVVYTKK